jgi:hypothetical protein
MKLVYGRPAPNIARGSRGRICGFWENVTFRLPAPYATCVMEGGPSCQFSKRYEVTNTGLAAGAGAQFKFGSLSVRGEYERFSAAGGNPSLFSLGLTWTFL